MSAARLLEHRRLWARKPELRAVYAEWFELLVAELPARGRSLEVGAGPGFFGEAARAARPGLRLVTLDLLAVPWNDVAGDAARLPFASGCFDALVGLDVAHHLARPAEFFREAARVLRPGGRLALVEPWVSPFSYPIYRFFHQEGLRPGRDPWRPFEHEKDAFDGDGGVFTALLKATRDDDWRGLGFEAPRVLRLNGFAYLLSLGFREASLLPARLAGAARACDRATSALAPLLALRACARWRRLEQLHA